MSLIVLAVIVQLIILIEKVMEHVFLISSEIVQFNRNKLINKKFKIENNIELWMTTQDGIYTDISIWIEGMFPQHYLNQLEQLNQKGEWLVVYDSESEEFEIYDFKNAEDYIKFINSYEKKPLL